MRIAGTGRALAAGAGREAGRAAASGAGFRLPGGDAAAAEPAAISTAVPLTSVEALMMLQQVPDAAERRRRSVRRGSRLLEGLAEVQLALLDGALSPAALARLQAEMAGAREAIDDPGLASVLAQIEVRAAVELAKLEAAGAA